MKKYFPFLALSVLLGSCNSPNDITPNQSNRLSGRYYWDVWKNNLTGATLQITTCRRQNYIQFNSDGTFSRRGWDANPCIQTEIDDGTYEYNITTAKITVRFTDGPGGAINTEVWNNIQLPSNRITFTWDENLDGRDEHYMEYLKN
jgi:hypothetical protein